MSPIETYCTNQDYHSISGDLVELYMSPVEPYCRNLNYCTISGDLVELYMSPVETYCRNLDYYIPDEGRTNNLDSQETIRIRKFAFPSLKELSM